MQMQFGLIAGNTSDKITSLNVNLNNDIESGYFHYIKKSPVTETNEPTDLSGIYWDVPLKTYLNYGLPTCKIDDKPVKLFSVIPSGNNYDIYKFASYKAVRTDNKWQY